MRIAAVGDLHCTRQAHGTFRTLFAEASAVADVFGLELEALSTGDGAGLWPQPVHERLAAG